MHVLVTGSSGVVGETIIKNLNNKYFKYGTFRKNKPKEIHKNIKLIKTNFSNLTKLPVKCDIIIHCAADSPENNPDKLTLKKNNINITKKIIDYADLKNVKIIFFMSSMAVYGRITNKLVDETIKFNDQSSYGSSKEICENLIINWSKKSKKKYIIFRLPGVVGKNSSRNFISETFKKIINNKKITISNPDSYFNNIIHAKNLSDFINYNIKNLSLIKNNIFNIASKNPIKIKSLIGIIYKQLNKKKNLHFIGSNNQSFLINYKKIKYYGFNDISVKKSLIKYISDNI